MDKGNKQYTHRDFRNAKVIHLEEKDNIERFIYEKQEITKEEAIEITAQYYAERQKKRTEEL